MRKILTRRDLVKGSAALGLTAFAAPLKAAAPEPVAITPALVEASRKEAKVILYSSMDLPVGEKLGRAFEAKYPGIEVLPITPEVAIKSANLPGDFHEDPADRIIVATARVFDCALVTSDEKIIHYSHVKSIY